jgi:hypothetical protein
VDDEKRGAQVFYRLVMPRVMHFFECVASVREKPRHAQHEGLIFWGLYFSH